MRVQNKDVMDFMVQGKINRGRHTDNPAGRHSIRAHLHHPPHIFYRPDALPAAQPTVSNQDNDLTEICMKYGKKWKRMSSVICLSLTPATTDQSVLIKQQKFLTTKDRSQSVGKGWGQMSHLSVPDPVFDLVVSFNMCIHRDVCVLLSNTISMN